MKYFAVAAGILALAGSLATAQSSTWVSDPMHSEVDFTITHMAISNVHGRFGKVAATLVYDAADVTKSTVTATIGVGTVDTGEDARNNHLKTPDFFDIATFPTATFTSTSVAKSGTGLVVNGNLTLHDHNHQPHSLRHWRQVSRGHGWRRGKADHRPRRGKAVRSVRDSASRIAAVESQAFMGRLVSQSQTPGRVKETDGKPETRDRAGAPLFKH